MKSMQKLLRELPALEGPFLNFDTKNLPKQPSDLFIDWLRLAIDKGISEPHKMVVSTVDDQGAPDARVLLLKNVTKNSWYFAGSKISRKGEQLGGNDQVALTFYWSELGRQIRIRGQVTSMPEDKNTVDFLERSEGARAIALLDQQSQKLEKQEDLDHALSQSRDRLREEPDLVNPHWTLYEVEAREVEFWQGDTERKHQRVQYLRRGEDWHHQLLWP